MAGTTPGEAVEAFIRPVRRSLLCVTDQVIVHRGGYHVGALGLAGLGNPEPIRLRDTDLGLSVALHYHIVEAEGERGPIKVSTSGYYYTVHDQDGRDILAFHWHPQVGVTYPHLHIGAGAQAGRPEFEHAHIPTGRVALEAVLRLLIRDFGVRPLRPEWDRELAEAEMDFETWRTWG